MGIDMHVFFVNENYTKNGSTPHEIGILRSVKTTKESKEPPNRFYPE